MLFAQIPEFVATSHLSYPMIVLYMQLMRPKQYDNILEHHNKKKSTLFSERYLLGKNNDFTFYVSRYLLKMANYYSVYTFSNCIKYFWNTLFFVSYPEEKKYVRPVHLIQLNDFFLLDNHYSLKHGLLYQLYFMCCHRFNNTSSLMHRVRNFHVYTFQKYNKF